ncbi:MAG TPA: hypothetical protein ENJ84_14245 [Gammaproteobacteria bacterium]|nr:hypothetical protein [Gammaproteobacteria bacterium]
MSKPIIFSIVESSSHPNASGFYQHLGFQEYKFSAMRKALGKLKTLQPDFVVAEFFYGYGNNYAGVNVSNLDTLLSTLQRYAPEAKMVVMVEKAERAYVDKLEQRFPLHAVLVHPVTPEQLQIALTAK